MREISSIGGYIQWVKLDGDTAWKKLSERGRVEIYNSDGEWAVTLLSEKSGGRKHFGKVIKMLKEKGMKLKSDKWKE